MYDFNAHIAEQIKMSTTKVADHVASWRARHTLVMSIEIHDIIICTSIASGHS